MRLKRKYLFEKKFVDVDWNWLLRLRFITSFAKKFCRKPFVSDNAVKTVKHKQGLKNASKINFCFEHLDK